MENITTPENIAPSQNIAPPENITPPAESSMNQPKKGEQKSVALIFAIVLIASVGARLISWPAKNEERDVDEKAYLKGSLALVEGLPAGNKAAPAGPNFWVGWVYTMGVAAEHMARPNAAERALPVQVRAFAVLDRALFEQYHDLNHLHELWIVTQALLCLWATVAAVQIGLRWGGRAGGLFCGGIFALAPVFVSFTVMSRPYMTAWAFGVLALRFAVLGSGGRRVVMCGILYGLAVASRIEMLLFAPVILWAFWDQPLPRKPLVSVVKLTAIAVLTTLLTAPWLMTNLIGTVRTIATVRFGPDSRGISFRDTLLLLSWKEGFGPAVLICLAGILLLPFARERTLGGKFKLACLLGYVVLLLLSLSGGTVFFHQQGPVLLTLIVVAPIVLGLAPLARLSESARIGTVAVLLLLPLGDLVYGLIVRHRGYYVEGGNDWVIQHIPAGTRIYTEQTLHDLLPTQASADAQWAEVTDGEAWKKKFQAGLSRFHLQTSEIPRAMSEENLVQERGNRRGEFILGSQPDYPEPRYDIRLYASSPVFGAQDPIAEFKKTGGVLLQRAPGPTPELGSPAATFLNHDGAGMFIYVLPRPIDAPTTAPMSNPQ